MVKGTSKTAAGGLGLASVALAACGTLLGIDLPPLRDDDAGAADVDAAGDGGSAPSSLPPAIASSCRGIKEREPSAPSGTYALLGQDGGFVCDMDTADGGWTRVRADMITEGTNLDKEPASPNKLDVFRVVDETGAPRWKVTVTSDDCNQGPDARAFHYVLVGELDRWEELMATYAFGEGVGCWALFGNVGDDQESLPDLDMRPFDPAIDVVDLAENMNRTTAGAAIPFAGRTGYCGPGRENFWHADYRSQRRTARVRLRRRLQNMPAGVHVATSCGTPTWELGDLYVR